MKVKYTGNFTNDNISKFKELQSEIKKLKDNNIPYEFSNENPLLRSGIKIILDDSNTEFINKLISWNFLKDDDYTPIDQEKQEAERKAEQDKLEAERKANQDEINEKENKPNLIKALDEMPYNDMPKNERDVLPFDQLADYHSNMVQKQNLIKELTDPILKPQYQERDDLQKSLSNNKELVNKLPNVVTLKKKESEELSVKVNELNDLLTNEKTVNKTEIRAKYDLLFQKKQDIDKQIKVLNEKLSNIVTEINTQKVKLDEKNAEIKSNEKIEIDRCGVKTFEQLTEEYRLMKESDTQ